MNNLEFDQNQIMKNFFFFRGLETLNENNPHEI